MNSEVEELKSRIEALEKRMDQERDSAALEALRSIAKNTSRITERVNLLAAGTEYPAVS
jgi:outer membrane murein-binding lipoprotein Lpp